ncbi:MAG: alpha/beta fold hydrolase, partial [Candidatus Hydrogenedentes bacterium]|nr:alpha/beta fold hydrolase [Candidatus Hydrogenedentota bacterium]
CEFERAHLDAKVVFDADGAIAGLFFLPAADAAPPPYVSRSRFDEREVHLGADPWQLPGTLSVPKGAGPFPAIVLVHGSGPQDRDETVGANKPFRDLAWGLASRGIAVLRYDKRTLHCAAKLQPLPLPFTVNEETVDDVTAAVTVLRATPEIDSARVFVLGHSLGGMLVPRIAKRTPDAAGFAILAGTARPLEDVIIEQTNYIALLDGAKSMDEQKQIDAVQAEVNRIKALTQADTQNSALIFGVPASYWLDLRAYDPVAEADSIARPLLILQGQRDYQVTMTDFARWKSALGGRPNVTLKTYAALNHLFIAGAGASGPAEYAAPGHVAPKVIDDIAAWMNAR